MLKTFQTDATYDCSISFNRRNVKNYDKKASFLSNLFITRAIMKVCESIAFFQFKVYKGDTFSVSNSIQQSLGWNSRWSFPI